MKPPTLRPGTDTPGAGILMASSGHPHNQPRITHGLEQLQAALRDISPVLHSFHDNLTTSGFTDRQALRLTSTALQELMRKDRG